MKLTTNKIVLAAIAIVILCGIYYAYSTYTTEMSRIKRRKAKRKAHTHMMKKAHKKQRALQRSGNGCKNPKMAVRRSYIVSTIPGI